MFYFESFDQELIQKKVSKFKYNTAGFSRKGIESSTAVLGKYGFFADNTGNLFCLDLVTFKPKWFINNFDDTDASLVIDREENNYYLYSGNEVDHRKPEALSKIRKIEFSIALKILFKILIKSFLKKIYQIIKIKLATLNSSLCSTNLFDVSC